MQRARGAALGSMLRGAVLRHVRISCPQHMAAGARRLFSSSSEEAAHAHGTYLNKNEVVDRVLNVVKTFPKVDPSKVTPSSSFQKDLGLDSLDTVEVVMAFEDEFALEIPDSEADKIASCADAIEYIASHPQAK
ncbi:hypothetical protein O6H91_19G004600 [Diphasiastrum complanatum]|uniref:Uncharacterized protein n=1 Tax=Diphasiastrum complanatum TaxID=34168 RepID=A0ACC2ASA1_DIPCM|nr:hypothetical protein O6H91_Y277400 [Diphasiastrum complanatum]KAJ7520406.1 hypothetical protein O6H91_19G004600 [Diphasiastrum complanatum]